MKRGPPDLETEALEDVDGDEKLSTVLNAYVGRLIKDMKTWKVTGDGNTRV